MATNQFVESKLFTSKGSYQSRSCHADGNANKSNASNVNVLSTDMRWWDREIGGTSDKEMEAIKSSYEKGIDEVGKEDGEEGAESITTIIANGKHDNQNKKNYAKSDPGTQFIKNAKLKNDSKLVNFTTKSIMRDPPSPASVKKRTEFELEKNYREQDKALFTRTLLRDVAEDLICKQLDEGHSQPNQLRIQHYIRQASKEGQKNKTLREQSLLLKELIDKRHRMIQNKASQAHVHKMCHELRDLGKFYDSMNLTPDMLDDCLTDFDFLSEDIYMDRNTLKNFNSNLTDNNDMLDNAYKAEYEQVLEKIKTKSF